MPATGRGGSGWQNLSRWWLTATATFAFIVSGSELRAQGMEVPATVQIPLMYKILSFDRNFLSRVGDEVVIGILYQEGYRGSVVAREQVEEALSSTETLLAGRIVRWVAIKLDDGGTLAAALRHREIDVLYVGPLRGIRLEELLSITRAAHVTTFTGVPDYVERGLSVGIGLNQERPQIVINLAAARAEGSDFNAQLLRVSRVIGEAR
jgi:hypothetical protein